MGGIKGGGWHGNWAEHFCWTVVIFCHILSFLDRFGGGSNGAGWDGTGEHFCWSVVIFTLRRLPRLAGDQHCDRIHRLAFVM